MATEASPLGNQFRRYLEGDASAGNQVFTELRLGLVRFLYSRCNDAALVEDTAHNALIVLMIAAREGRLENLDKAKAYAAKTALRNLRDVRKSAAHRTTAADTELVETVSDAGKSALETIDDQTLATLVREFLDDLPNDRYRDLLRRRFLVEESKTITCAALDMEPDRYDDLIFKARASFRNRLKKHKHPAISLSAAAKSFLLLFGLLALILIAQRDPNRDISLANSPNLQAESAIVADQTDGTALQERT